MSMPLEVRCVQQATVPRDRTVQQINEDNIQVRCSVLPEDPNRAVPLQQQPELCQREAQRCSEECLS